MTGFKAPLVSVWMITYNHEKYIAQAIESVLEQVTNFDFELVIGEDCSTDRTRSICLQYQQRFPNRIRILQHLKNVGIHQNIILTLEACTGQYVALLEGDDYWTDPMKLQKQVQFLVNNPDFVMCYQKTLEINELTGIEKVTNDRDNEVTGLEEILERGWFMRTGSLVFKNGLLKEFPSWFYEFSSTDYMLHILIAQHGKVGFLNETTSVYRRHLEGITQTFQKKTLQFNKRKLQLLEIINGYFSYEYDSFIKVHKNHLYTSSFIALVRSISSLKDIYYLMSLLSKIDHSHVLKRIIKFVLGKKVRSN